VTLVATGPEVHVQGPDGQRTSLLETFYREPGSTPHIETSIDHGELIVAVSVPPLPAGDRSVYLKLRERASYEFALVSVAASVALEGGVIGEARIALGGVATRAWRSHETEAMLRGVALDTRRGPASPSLPAPTLSGPTSLARTLSGPTCEAPSLLRSAHVVMIDNHGFLLSLFRVRTSRGGSAPVVHPADQNEQWCFETDFGST